MKNILLAATILASTSLMGAEDKYQCKFYTDMGDLQTEAAAEALKDYDYISAEEHLIFAKQNYFQNAYHCKGREKKLERVNRALSNKSFKMIVARQKFIKASR